MGLSRGATLRGGAAMQQSLGAVAYARGAARPACRCKRFDLRRSIKPRAPGRTTGATGASFMRGSGGPGRGKRGSLGGGKRRHESAVAASRHEHDDGRLALRVVAHALGVALRLRLCEPQAFERELFGALLLALELALNALADGLGFAPRVSRRCCAAAASSGCELPGALRLCARQAGDRSARRFHRRCVAGRSAWQRFRRLPARAQHSRADRGDGDARQDDERSACALDAAKSAARVPLASKLSRRRTRSARRCSHTDGGARSRRRRRSRPAARRRARGARSRSSADGAPKCGPPRPAQLT